MLIKFHQLVAAIGLPQFIALCVLGALWLLEQILAQTKSVRANSIVQAVFNALYKLGAARFPLVSRLSNVADQVILQIEQTTTTATVAVDKTPAETPAARTKQAGFVRMGVLLVVAALGVTICLVGCATSATPKGATLAQKVADDGAALNQIMLDVEQKCGPQFVSLTPVLNGILAVAKDPTNVIGDVIAAIDAYAPLKADAGAALCVLKTVTADIKALQPAKTAQIDRLVAQIEAGQSL